MDGKSSVERAYRAVMEPEGLTCYRLKIGESDLYICTAGETLEAALSALRLHGRIVRKCCGSGRRSYLGQGGIGFLHHAKDSLRAIGAADLILPYGHPAIAVNDSRA